MRDLDLALADRDQPIVGEHGEHLGDAVRPSSSASAHAPAHDGVALALAREPQQDPARDLAAAGVEPLVRALGQPRDRAVHAAGLLVGAQAQAPAVALLPQLEQRGRQQRQRAGLALDVRDQRVDELGLDLAVRRAAPGSSIARRSSSRRIGPTSTWLAPSSRDSSG